MVERCVSAVLDFTMSICILVLRACKIKICHVMNYNMFSFSVLLSYYLVHSSFLHTHRKGCYKASARDAYVQDIERVIYAYCEIYYLVEIENKVVSILRTVCVCIENHYSRRVVSIRLSFIFSVLHFESCMMFQRYR